MEFIAETGTKMSLSISSDMSVTLKSVPPLFENCFFTSPVKSGLIVAASGAE